MVLFNAPSTHVHSQAAVAEGGGWRPEAVAHFVEAARKGAAPPFVRSEAAPPLSLSARALQTVSAASLAEARTSMRQIVLLLHEPRGRWHRHLVRVRVRVRVNATRAARRHVAMVPWYSGWCYTSRAAGLQQAPG
eukprot:scaffold21142_cov45-Phaeocystis_antarctica.AAC.1